MGGGVTHWREGPLLEQPLRDRSLWPVAHPSGAWRGSAAAGGRGALLGADASMAREDAARMGAW